MKRISIIAVLLMCILLLCSCGDSYSSIRYSTVDKSNSDSPIISESYNSYGQLDRQYIYYPDTNTTYIYAYNYNRDAENLTSEYVGVTISKITSAGVEVLDEEVNE